MLLEAVERKARAEDCCRITLEVQEHNDRARHVYGAAGFAQAVHVEAAGGALFLSKPLQGTCLSDDLVQIFSRPIAPEA